MLESTLMFVLKSIAKVNYKQNIADIPSHPSLGTSKAFNSRLSSLQ